MFDQLQRTTEWHEQRRGRITGSQAGALLGLSPHQTQAQAIRAWVRSAKGAESEILDNPAFAYGRRHERAAQLAMMRHADITIDDCGFLTHGDWLGASPDGLTDDGGVAETKCPFSWRAVIAPEPKPLAELPHYYAQVQLEILCSGRSHAHFCQYRPPIGDPLQSDYEREFLRYERVEIDYEWREHYLPELRSIWEMLQEELDNPAHLEPLRVQLSTTEAQRLVEYITELDASIEQATAARAAALEDLVKMADGKNAEAFGRKLTLVKRAGTISYAKAIKALAPDADLEQWRGKSSEYWMLG